MKVKIKPFKLYIRNGRRQMLNARNIASISGKLPTDVDLMRRYILHKEVGDTEFEPFVVPLSHDESVRLLKEIEMKKDGCYPVEALRGYDIILDNTIVCKIDMNVDLKKL